MLSITILVIAIAILSFTLGIFVAESFGREEDEV